MTEITIPLRSHDEAILVLGPYDRYAKLLRQSLDVELFTRNGNLRLKGADEALVEARRRVEHVLGKVRKGRDLGVREMEEILSGGPPEPSRQGSRRAEDERALDGVGRLGTPAAPSAPAARPRRGAPARAAAGVRARAVQPRTENQRRYLEEIEKKDLVFGTGMAGTGKTFLAVTSAVRMLRSGECRRLIITRPVVEAGERLGFLPGDLAAKLDPYMRPIYDALHAMLDFEDVARLEETGVIEVAPLAYMRGRTLSNSFVILDEAQNTTVGQMKMFLTRLGEGSRMVVTGDPSQNDLPESQRSGLNDAVERLQGYGEIGIVEFDARDIVRHPLVERIVHAYDAPRRASKPARGEEKRGEDKER